MSLLRVLFFPFDVLLVILYITALLIFKIALNISRIMPTGSSTIMAWAEDVQKKEDEG